MSVRRRDFLTTSMGASTLLSMHPAAPEFLCRAARAAEMKPQGDDAILVVIQLAGGNDGLNTLVPYADDHYARARQTLRLTHKEVLRIDSLLGFHPAMPSFARLLKEGLLTVVQGVGYPNPVDSHEVSMRIWQTANREEPEAQTGWLGSAADRLAGAGMADVPAVFVGQIRQPFTLNAGRAIVPTIRCPEDCTIHAPTGPEADADTQRCLRAAEVSRDGAPNPLLDLVQRTTAAACAASRRIRQVATSPALAEYPAIPLAAMLRTIAQLIRADLGIRIYYAELGGEEPGGFDNHANQRDNHASLLRQLSQSVAAFLDDLRSSRRLDRVLLMTFSEFGRTVAENGRRGTDHGSAAPMFLAGGKLRGGLVGPHPDLAQREKGGVKHHTDFRRVYATVLDRWLGVDSQAVLQRKFDPLDLW